MALSSPTKFVRCDGEVCYGAANLATAFPHGGTAIGSVHGVYLRKLTADYRIKAEEYGFETVEVVQSGEAWALVAFLRGWDDEALAQVWPNTAVGSVSQRTTVAAPGTNRAGRFRATGGVKLVFSPHNTLHHNFVVAYRAVPIMDTDAAMHFDRNEELGMPIVFECLRDASARTLFIGRRDDVTL